MRTYIIFTFVFACIAFSHAQVGIGTTAPDASAILELQSANTGLLLPRLDLTTNPITAPAEGLMVYNTVDNGCEYSKGVYIYIGTRWRHSSYKSTASSGRLVRDQIGVANVTTTYLNADDGGFGDLTDLFDGDDIDNGTSMHCFRRSTTQDWGFIVGLPDQYTISNIGFNGRAGFQNRLNGVVVELYRCGTIVHTSAPLTGANAGINNVAIPNVLTDEIRVIIPNGGTTAGGQTLINFNELLVTGFL